MNMIKKPAGLLIAMALMTNSHLLGCSNKTKIQLKSSPLSEEQVEKCISDPNNYYELLNIRDFTNNKPSSVHINQENKTITATFYNKEGQISKTGEISPEQLTEILRQSNGSFQGSCYSFANPNSK